jgi:uncharacterized protein with von Willebrand factor type A (vWA) domain
MIEAGRTEAGRNPPHHRDAEIDLADGRLQAIHDVAWRLQLAESADGRHEIELDAGEQLTELVVQLACDARPLFFAHLLEALRQRGIEIGARGEWQFQAACTCNTAAPFRACLSEIV